MSVTDADGCRQLVCRLLQQAIKDATNRRLDPTLRGDAIAWLTDGGLTWCCAWLDLDRDALLEALDSRRMLPTEGEQLELWT